MDLIGVFGLDVLVALLNVLLAQIILKRAHLYFLPIYGFIIISWAIYGMKSFEKYEDQDRSNLSLPIGIVQPGIPSQAQNELRHHSGLKYKLDEFAISEKLAESGAKLIIWPEATRKQFFDDEVWRSRILTFAKNKSLYLQIHGFDKHESIPGTYISSAVMVSPSGMKVNSTAKNRLIPFVEAVPTLFRPFIANSDRYLVNGVRNFSLSEGAKKTKTSLKINSTILKSITLICFESVFNVSDLDRSEIDIIFIIANNNGFGQTHLPFLHERFSALRAIESRSVVVNVTTNGPSSVFSSSGKRLFSSKLGFSGGHVVTVPIMTSSSD